MSASDPSLNDLIRAQRSGVGLSEPQRAANRARLLASAASAASALGVSGGAKAAAGLTGWLAPGAIAVALAGAAGVAYVTGWGAATESKPSSSARPAVLAPVASQAPASATASNDIESSTSPSPAVPPPETLPAASGRSRARSAPSAPPAASSSLASEVQLMHDVNVALKSGQPGRALALLEAPRAGDAGYMREEREAARVFALCQAGNQSAARTEAAAFLRKHPRSPLAGRVSASCASSTNPATSKSKG